MEVVLVMNRTPGRPGAALVVDAAGKLAGIFTHGDLARLLERGSKLDMRVPIDEFIGRNPKTIDEDRLVEEAQRLIAEHRIDQIPVIDAERRPVGLLDVQDLLDVRL
jgi:arabinose-5-phosphate isomerase